MHPVCNFIEFEKIKNCPIDFLDILCFVFCVNGNKHLQCVGYPSSYAQGASQIHWSQAVCISARKKWMQTFFVKHCQLAFKKLLKKKLECCWEGTDSVLFLFCLFYISLKIICPLLSLGI